MYQSYGCAHCENWEISAHFQDLERPVNTRKYALGVDPWKSSNFHWATVSQFQIFDIKKKRRWKYAVISKNEILWDLEWMRFFLWNILNMSIMHAG